MQCTVACTAERSPWPRPAAMAACQGMSTTEMPPGCSATTHLQQAHLPLSQRSTMQDQIVAQTVLTVSLLHTQS